MRMRTSVVRWAFASLGIFAAMAAVCPITQTAPASEHEVYFVGCQGIGWELPPGTPCNPSGPCALQKTCKWGAPIPPGGTSCGCQP